jgi:hypothetical protein
MYRVQIVLKNGETRLSQAFLSHEEADRWAVTSRQAVDAASAVVFETPELSSQFGCCGEKAGCLADSLQVPFCSNCGGPLDSFEGETHCPNCANHSAVGERRGMAQGAQPNQSMK